MSDIKFNCPSCKQSLEAPPEMGGQLIECPTCKKTIDVPFPPRPNKPAPPTPPQERPRNCVGCGWTLPADAVLCTSCGTNQKTGKKLQLKCDEPARDTTANGAPSGSRSCPFCGETILRSAIKCKHCGEFLDGSHRTKPTELAESQGTIKVLVTSMVIAAVLCGGGYLVYKNITDTKKKQQDEAAATQYRTELAGTSDMIIEASSTCLQVCSAHSGEWGAYVRLVHEVPSPSYLLYEFKKNEGGEELLKKMERDKNTVDGKVRALASPPPQFQKAHEAFAALFGIYGQLYDSATSPSGSYLSYSTSINDLQGRLTKTAYELKGLIP